MTGETRLTFASNGIKNAETAHQYIVDVLAAVVRTLNDMLPEGTTCTISYTRGGLDIAHVELTVK